MEFRYLKNVATLELDRDRCTGCRMCTQVCGHAVFVIDEKVVQIQDRDSCMECGACAMNCPAEAVTVRPGVGCAWAIVTEWFKRKDGSGEGKIECDCS